MNKKALFFTIGAMMVALIILSLSIIILNASENTKLRLAESAAFDKLYDLDASIKKSVVDIVKNSLYLDITTTTNTTSFNETLPHDFTALNTLILDFGNFTSSNIPEATLNTEQFINDGFPLKIMPYSIKYKHENNNLINITAQSQYPEEYSLDITVYTNITSCTWDLTNGSFPLTISSKGTGSMQCPKTQQINAVSSNTAIINMVGGNISITIENYDLTIESTSAAEILTTITLDEEDIFIEPGESIVNISLSGNNLSKTD